LSRSLRFSPLRPCDNDVDATVCDDDSNANAVIEDDDGDDDDVGVIVVVVVDDVDVGIVIDGTVN